MTKDEALQILDTIPTISEQVDALEMAIKALEQEPCEMTAEDYRQRMMQAFHNADCDELIAVCVLPTEKEFEHLEWLLKNHYKKEPCEDAISKEAVLKCFTWTNDKADIWNRIKKLAPITSQRKMGRWILSGGYWRCSECKEKALLKLDKSKGGCREYEPVRSKHCPSCGAKMESEDKE